MFNFNDSKKRCNCKCKVFSFEFFLDSIFCVDMFSFGSFFSWIVGLFFLSVCGFFGSFYNLWKLKKLLIVYSDFIFFIRLGDSFVGEMERLRYFVLLRVRSLDLVLEEIFL